MQIVLATDIFGINDWTNRLVKVWREQGYKAFAVAPYQQQLEFCGETDAYAKFTQEGGFEGYCNKVKLALKNVSFSSPTLYIGFSAGGAALWKILGENDSSTNSHLIAFYPGQIRHHLDKLPAIEASLIFPKSEQHFDLSKVIEYLVTKPTLNIVQNNLLHGYANLYSQQYHQKASEALFDLLSQPKMCLCQSRFNETLFDMVGEHKLISSKVEWQ